VRRRWLIPGKIDIDFRPDIVEHKLRIGDWELDTIVGAQHKGTIVSMVEKGLYEQINGLARQYIPKKMFLFKAYLARIKFLLNN
jgi:IS30 family transposase